MNKQDMLKIQSCVLRVNIHCDGCKHKVKKQLQKVEGVYKVSIDVEQGKVTVSGNVDPETLIKKLEKSGKHAELWGPQKGGPIPNLNNQFFKDFQIENNNSGKDGKLQKGSKEQQNGFKNQLINGMQAPQQMHQKKSLKEEKSFGKDQKSVKFNLPPEDDDDVYSDSDDEDEFDDEFDGDFAAHPLPKKGPGSQANKDAPNGHVKGKSGANNVGKPKKVGGIDAFIKGMLGKVGGKNGNVGKKSSKKAENHKEDGGKNSKKNGKSGSKSDKGVTHNGKANDSWTKKVGENYDGGPKLKSKKQVFDEIHTDYKGGGGGGGGKNMNPMGQMGNFPAVQGLPTAAAMNVGRLQGAGQGNPYNQGAGQGNPYNQQYMQHMMMMNQQRENGYDSFHPSAYMRPQPPMGYGPAPVGYGPYPVGYGPAPMGYGAAPAGYGPAPPSDQYAHIFNDENTDSCSIM